MSVTYPHLADCCCSAKPAQSNSSYSHGSWLMWRWKRCRNCRRCCHYRCQRCFHSLIATVVAQRCLEPGIASVPELVAMCRPWRRPQMTTTIAADDSDCRWSWVASGSDCCCCHSSLLASCCSLLLLLLPLSTWAQQMASDPFCWPTSWAA